MPDIPPAFPTGPALPPEAPKEPEKISGFLGKVFKPFTKLWQKSGTASKQFNITPSADEKATALYFKIFPKKVLYRAKDFEQAMEAQQYGLAKKIFQDLGYSEIAVADYVEDFFIKHLDDDQRNALLQNLNEEQITALLQHHSLLERLIDNVTTTSILINKMPEDLFRLYFVASCIAKGPDYLITTPLKMRLLDLAILMKRLHLLEAVIGKMNDQELTNTFLLSKTKKTPVLFRTLIENEIIDTTIAIMERVSNEDLIKYLQSHSIDEITCPEIKAYLTQRLS